jgi:hypothetical protein
MSLKYEPASEPQMDKAVSDCLTGLIIDLAAREAVASPQLAIHF